jgi:acetylornithine deacetylase/succinyl-diaminopimelate desuccinylase-like protein
MPDPRSSSLQYAHDNRERFLNQLKGYLEIPSVSTDREHKEDIERAAQWTTEQIKGIGMQNVDIFATEGHPVVYGEYLKAGVDVPTILVYGHYDVQPADPLDLWKSGPFEPEVRGENLYARGASDMKGQVLATIKALEAVASAGEIPVNVKFLIEGEEEIGSPNLGNFIRNNKDLLSADYALNPDTGMIAPDKPTITYGLRGLAYFELRVYGPDHDLHSGLYGGVVHNPAQVLSELIAGMHDEQGRITLPGFYDRVRQLSEEERAELARLPMDEDYYLGQTGAPALWGEEGYTPIERVGARPTLEVNGILSGFTGEGSKTVLPAQAMAKISCRLVPEQDPEEVYQQLLDYLEKQAPATIRCEVTKLASGKASISNRHSPGINAMEKAQESVWGRKPVFRREGGSVPVVGQFQDLLGLESINCGFGLPDDNLHSPNEKQHLPTWYRGIDTLIHFFYNLGE